MKKWIFPVLPFLLLGFAVFYYVNRNPDISESRYSDKKDFKADNKSNENQIIDDFSSIDNQKQEQTVSFALDIKGTEDFKSKIKESLRVLWLYDKEGSFRLVRRYVFEIRESNRTMFYWDNEKPIAEVSKEMVDNNSKTYLASVLAHLGWHGYYLTEKKGKNKKDVPLPGKENIDKSFAMPFGTDFKKLDDLYKVEEEAFKYQLSVLNKINAPQNEQRILKNRDYKDFSPAHDGNYFIQF